MIAFLILSCLVLGLWLFRMPWPASLILLLIGVGFAFYRFKGRGLLIFVLATMGGWAITNLDRIEPPNQETYRGLSSPAKKITSLFKVALTSFTFRRTIIIANSATT